jgi:hypothetical protein
VAEGEAQELLFDLERDLVGHPWRPTFTRLQNVVAEAHQIRSPAVIGGAMNAQHPAGGLHTAELLGQRHRAEPETKDGVMIGHGGAS